MNGKPFFDSSVLLYLLAKDDSRAVRAEAVLVQGGFLSVQVLNEFASVAHRKLKLTWPQVEQALADVQIFCEPPVAVDLAIHRKGLAITARYRLQLYDSMIVAAALACGCATLWSEDMQDGQVIEGMTIRNPFRTYAE